MATLSCANPDQSSAKHRFDVGHAIDHVQRLVGGIIQRNHLRDSVWHSVVNLRANQFSQLHSNRASRIEAHSLIPSVYLCPFPKIFLKLSSSPATNFTPIISHADCI